MSILEQILDKNEDPQRRGRLLLKEASSGRLKPHTIEEVMNEDSEYLRSSAALALAYFPDDRTAYPLFMRLLEDDSFYVRGDAILAMGKTANSRFTFALINYFKNRANHHERERIMMALALSKDPRATAFLQEHLDDHNHFAQLVRNAYDHCKNNASFVYAFAGSDQLWKGSLHIQGRIFLGSPHILDTALSQIRRYGLDRPQTYIVDERGMWIGGLIGEHVDVARGKKVLAAGEIIFTNEQRWKVEYVNNRSNGYYPDPSSFAHVAGAFKEFGIAYAGDNFSETFPKEGFNDPEFLSFQPLSEK